MTMSESSNSPVNFSDIEAAKENIVQLKKARSAKRLKRGLSQDFIRLTQARNGYEKRLVDELPVLENPLSVFIEYIDWIQDTVPQGAGTSKSGLLDVMERCLMYFNNNNQYKNNIQYLQIWLSYIELFFCDSNRESRDIFVYMLRNGIGEKLSLFYQEFSKLLFSMEKFNESYEVLKLGIKENAEPVENLFINLESCELSLMEKGITVENYQLQLNEYFSKVGNPKILDRDLSTILQSRKLVSEEIKFLRGSSDKIQILKDDSGSEDEKNDDSNSNIIFKDNWNKLESKTTKLKENKLPSKLIEPNTNVGSMRQNTEAAIRQSKPFNKMSIFNDETGRNGPIYKLIHVEGQKSEKIDCNFDLIYPNDGKDEYNIEQLLALSRNVYYKSVKRTHA